LLLAAQWGTFSSAHTIPNRWFPIEFHTQPSLLHWLPTRVYRVIYQTLGYYGFFAEQANLSLMTQANLNCATAGLTGWRFRVDSARLLGLKSNLILVARR
jgi:hypothetical protein